MIDGKLIVLIHTNHPNDIESAKSEREAFAEYGYIIEEVSVRDPRATEILGSLLRDRAGEIFCFVSENFIGAGIRDAQNRLLHQFTGIPMVIYLHDHPLYFPGQWAPELKGSIVYAPGADQLDFIDTYLGLDVAGVVNSAFLTPAFAGGPPDLADFTARKNEILCPMNLTLWGQTLDQVWQQIKQLPAGRRDAARSLAEAALTVWDRPLHEIARSLPQQLSPADATAAVADQVLVLSFIKLWRRNRMVRAVIDLPVLISSDYVPADLEFKYPKKFTHLTMGQTTPLYRQYRFVLNCFPGLINALHERVINAMHANAVAVTDRNLAVSRYLTDGEDVVFVDHEGGSMAEKIAPYVDDVSLAYAITAKNYAVRQAGELTSRGSFGDLIEAVKERWRRTAAVASPAAQ